jgi:TrmH RNA methyltransferase
MVPRARKHRHKRPQRPAMSPPGAPAPEPAEKVHGLRAGLAVFEHRRHDILRVAYGRAVRLEVAEIARWAASRPLPCAEMSDAELDGFAESTHHDGLCVVARPRRWMSTQELANNLARTRGAAIALDRVRNPYNVGAVLRSAAFFGLQGALLGTPAPHPGLAPTAVRVAEGGAEHLQLARTTDLADTLGRLRALGVCIIGADERATTSAFGFAVGRPAVLVVGNERAGLGERVRARCDAVVAIPGRGRVDSLNVAVAAGVLISELLAELPRDGFRQQWKRGRD